MTTDNTTCQPRTVTIFINGRHYGTLSRCTVPIDRLQKRLISHALIGDGKIVLIESDDYCSRGESL